MSMRAMTRMAISPGAFADRDIPTTLGWSGGYWFVMLAMWWVMMVAMMTPSAAPMILLYARATRHAQLSGQIAPGVVPTATFAAGYLLVWLGFSVLATA